MKLDVVCVCRRPPRWVIDVTADYAKRLPHDLNLSFSYIAPGRDGLNASARKRDEAARILRKLGDKQAFVALDGAGRQVDSRTLASWLNEWRQHHERLGLVIGGADGLDEGLLKQARSSWSLSQLTLPHLLVQIVVAEQLYRAWSIDAGHPYHRE